MGTLGFFPWWHLDSELRAGKFRLAPFERGKAPYGRGTKLQSIVDAVLAPYTSGRLAHSRRATLVLLRKHSPEDDLSEDEIRGLIDFSEMVAFAGLSARRYFDQIRYANRDNFSFIAQRFTEPGRGVSIQTRRRDGSGSNYIPGNDYEVRCPHHVFPSRHEIDTRLLRSLLRRKEMRGWERFEEAIYWFNRANTDSPEATDESEMVPLVGAFERLLGCNGGDEHALAKAFLSAFRPVSKLSRSRCRRIPTAHFPKAKTIREVWIRDIYRLRHKPAHGQRNAGGMNPIWDYKEHLLLGSFSFPLTVKTLLRKDGVYAFRHKDSAHLDAFESLAASKMFSPSRSKTGREEWPWLRILHKFEFARDFKRIERLFYREQRRLSQTATVPPPSPVPPCDHSPASNAD